MNKKEKLAVDKFGATRQLREIIEQKYQIVELIGKGSYGSVSKAICKSTGKTVALKLMVD